MTPWDLTRNPLLLLLLSLLDRHCVVRLAFFAQAKEEGHSAGAAIGIQVVSATMQNSRWREENSFMHESANAASTSSTTHQLLACLKRLSLAPFASVQWKNH